MKKFRSTLLIIAVSVICFISGCKSNTLDEAMFEDACNAFIEDYKKEFKTIKSDFELFFETEEGLPITWEVSNEDVIDVETGKLKENLPNGGLDSKGVPLSVTFKANIQNLDAEDDVLSYEFTLQLDKSALSADALAVNTARGILGVNYETKAYEKYDHMSLVVDQETGDKSTKYALDLYSTDTVTITYTDTTFLKFSGATAELVKIPSEEDYTGESQYVVDYITYTITKGDVTMTDTISVRLYKPTLSLETAYSLEQMNELFVSGTYKSSTYYSIYGTVTEYLGLHPSNGTQCFYIQDGNYGLYVYQADVSDECPTVEVGDVVLVEAMVGSYSGLFETTGGDTDNPTIKSITILEKGGEDALASIPVLELTKENYNDSLQQSPSIRASLTNAVYISGSMTSGTTAHDLEFRFSDLETPVYVYCDKICDDFEEVKAFINSLKPGDVVTFETGIIGWNVSGPRFNIVNTSFKMSANQLTEEQCNEFINKNSDTFAPKSSYGTDLATTDANYAKDLANKALATETILGDAITWTITVDPSLESVITLGTVGTRQKVCVGTFEKLEQFTLTANWTRKDVNYSKDFTCYAFSETTTIGALIEAYKGSSFESNSVISGYVLYKSGDKYVVSDLDGNQAYVQGIDAVVGNYIECIITSISDENGIYVLTSSAVVTTSSTTNALAPRVVSVSTMTNDYAMKALLDTFTVQGGKFTAGNVEVSTELADGTYKNVVGYFLPSGLNTATFIKESVVNSYDEFLTAEKDTNVLLYGKYVGCVSDTYIFLSDAKGNLVMLYAQKQNYVNIDLVYGDYVYVEGKIGTMGNAVSKEGPLVLIQRIIKCANSLGYDYSDLRAASDYVVSLSDVPMAIEGSTYNQRRLVTLTATVSALDLSNNKITFKFANGTENKESYISASSYYSYDVSVKELVQEFKDAYITSLSNAGYYTFTITLIYNNSTNSTANKIYFIPELVTFARSK